MTAFVAALGPRQLGAEVLAHVARQRLTGTLQCEVAGKTRQLLLREGRPEGGVEADGSTLAAKPQVVALLRAVACCATGKIVFDPGTPAAGGASLQIDTLGEILLAAMQNLPSVQLDGLFAARAAAKVEAGPAFAKLAPAIAQVGGAAPLKAPAPGTPLQILLQSADAATARAWAALILLGGLRSEGWSLSLTPPGSAVPAQAAAPAAPTSPLGIEIAQAFARMPDQDHYAFLAVPKDATADTIRKAYFELAKRWHTDRLVNAGLTDTLKQQAEELFRRADEANRVLSNAEERKTYDWIIERQAAGLPTDPRVVMEAESTFRRGETLIRRGQAAAAEPLLRQAVQLNKGESEFWAYLGFAIYGVQGAAGVAEARDCLKKALQMRDKLDVAHEFLGRIAHSEGNLKEATKELNEALALNPKNTFAERELRLITMRQEQAKKPEEKKGLLGKLLKR